MLHGEKCDPIVTCRIKILSRSKLLSGITKEPVSIQTPLDLHDANLRENQDKKQKVAQQSNTFYDMCTVDSWNDALT